MRILFLVHAFNSLSQRLYLELAGHGHEVTLEFDVNDAVTEEAVSLFRPDLIIAPYLRRAIPESIWRRHVCLVVHPGIQGDRGPSALDWAILDGVAEWGVTVLQANEEMDGGDVWAEVRFPVGRAKKSSLYRNEVTSAAVEAALAAVAKFEQGDCRGKPLDLRELGEARGWRPLMGQEVRAIDWLRDDTATVLRKIHASDGFPGVLDEMGGIPCHLYDAHDESALRGAPGSLLARHGGALCRATRDGAVWIGHVKLKGGEPAAIKLPAAMALRERIADLPEIEPSSWREIRYEEKNSVGYLSFDFYNGAMGTTHCEALRAAFVEACGKDTRAIVLLGGEDFWSNGIHLNLIEAAQSPADESWRNINAMNDLARTILTTRDKFTIAALRGNAGAGGAFLALAADRILARGSAVLNPHYKAMGNLYGSEYWTYLLPRRVGAERAFQITDRRLPLGAPQAKAMGLIDECRDGTAEEFRQWLESEAEALVQAPDYAERLAKKCRQRDKDEAEKPLSAYREEELAHLKLNFYGFDSSYHVARYNFVFKVPRSRTPRHLALHRNAVRS